MTTARSDMLDAWVLFDRAAERHSDRRGFGATTETLVDVTEKMNATLRVYALELGIEPTKMVGVLLAWRRVGLPHHRALEAFEAGWRASGGTSGDV